MKFTYISVGFLETDRVRQEKLDRLIKMGVKKCRGHKHTTFMKTNYDDETINSRLFEEQCPFCGGYKEK